MNAIRQSECDESGTDRRRAWIVPAWIIVLALLIVGPCLQFGYVLRIDMVFTPEQTLLPWMLGVDGGLPRAAPQDAVVSLISGPIPGQILQKAVLLAIPLLAGFGMWRLLRVERIAVQLAGVSLAVWCPYLAQRLLMGHWALLLGFAVTPWVLVHLRRLRRGRLDAAPGLVLWVAVGSLVPTSSVFMMALVLPMVWTASAITWRWRLVVSLPPIAFALPWLVSAILNPEVGALDPQGASVFDLHPQSWGGPLLQALNGSGIWNNGATLASGAFPWVPVIAVLVIALAACGLRRAGELLGRGLIGWLSFLAVLGYVFAVVSTFLSQVSWWVSASAYIPGIGLVRDSQKLLLPLTVLIALTAPLGLVRVLKSIHISQFDAVALGCLAILPLALMPDLALGAFGRLNPASYPTAWNDVRGIVADGGPGEAVSLPWQTFRRYSWNNDRLVLDPAPRYMTRAVITDDSLSVGTTGGDVRVAGDNPRSAEIAIVLDSPDPYAGMLGQLGVRWVIEQTDQPNPVAARKLIGLMLRYEGGGLRLWEVPNITVRSPSAVPPVVVLANALAASCFLLAGVLAMVYRRRDCAGVN